MGILTDFFVAAPDDIDDELIETGPADRFPRLEAKGTDDVKITSLNGIATGRDFEVDKGFDSLHAEVEQIGEADEEEGPWLFRVPDALVRSLAAADATRLEHINEQWAGTDEWRGISPDDTRWLVEGLAEFARNAERAGKPLFLWISL